MKKRLTHIAALSLCMFALCATHQTQAFDDKQLNNKIVTLPEPLSFKNTTDSTIFDGETLICIFKKLKKTASKNLLLSEEPYSFQEIELIIKRVTKYQYPENTTINIKTQDGKFSSLEEISPKDLLEQKELFIGTLFEIILEKIKEQKQSEKDFSNEDLQSIKKSLEALNKYLPTDTTEERQLSIDLKSEKPNISLEKNEDTSLIASLCYWYDQLKDNLDTYLNEQKQEFLTQLKEKINITEVNKNFFVIVTNSKKPKRTIPTFINKVVWDADKANLLKIIENIITEKQNQQDTTNSSLLTEEEKKEVYEDVNQKIENTKKKLEEEHKKKQISGTWSWKKAIGVTATVAMGGYGLYWLFTHRKGAQQGQTSKNKLQQNTTLFALPKSLANPKKTA